MTTMFLAVMDDANGAFVEADNPKQALEIVKDYWTGEEIDIDPQIRIFVVPKPAGRPQVHHWQISVERGK